MNNALFMLGKSRVDLARAFGLDPTIPLGCNPPGKMPRPTMSNTVKVARFIGVSLPWLLRGEIRNDVDRYVSGVMQQQFSAMVAHAAHGATIIQSPQQSTVTVQQHYGGLSPQESDIINAYRALDCSRQAAVRAFIQGLTDEAR